MTGSLPLELVWNRLRSVVNEQQAVLIRTAFSPIVREMQDLACGVFDTRGRMLAQSQSGTPGHINAMATGVRHFVEAFPSDTLAPGDVLLTNDPWLTAGQINDITVVTPVFERGQVLGFFANTCHSPDIGGRLLSAEATEVYEEGLRIPIMKLFDCGEPNHTLLAIVEANVRTPDETIGDLYAQAACNDKGAEHLRALVAEFGLESLDGVAEDILGRSEQAMRDAIRALPTGRYEHRIVTDGFGEPITLALTLTILDDELVLDFTGSSAQSHGGINVVLNYTRAYASFAVTAAVSSDVPHNHGSFQPLTVTAPEGSILNCTHPAPVASRHILGHFLPSLVFGALAKAGVTSVTASGSDPIWISVWRGRSRESSPFTFTLFQAGGSGARPVKDGLSATGFPSGVAGVPAEVIETVSPLVQLRRELREDSGGPGRYRGGLGQHTEIRCRTEQRWTVSAMADRIDHPAPGLHGGRPGAPGAITDGDGRPLPAKTLLPLQPDDAIQFRLPGGGGYGDPLERDPIAVLNDVLAGYVSAEAARRDYGVVVNRRGHDALVILPEHLELDIDATRSERAARRVQDVALPLLEAAKAAQPNSESSWMEPPGCRSTLVT